MAEPIRPVNSPAPAPTGGSSVPAPAGAGTGSAAPVNPYYGSAARAFRAAKFLTLFVLIVFLLLSFTLGRNEITIENLRYLMKFISFTDTETSITAPRIHYPSSSQNKLGLFIGDLCALSDQGYSLYDSRGNQIMTEDIRYGTPVLTVGEKYTLCYDLGGLSFSLFNTFSQLYSETLDYPITDADLAPDGSFAVAASSREYRTAVLLYDADFKLISRVLKDKYLTDLCYDAPGENLAVMSIGTEEGSFFTEIELIRPGASQAHARRSVDGLGYNLFPVRDGWIMISDEAIWFLDADLGVKNRVSLAGPLAMTDCSQKYLTCIYEGSIIGNSYFAVVYDTNGRAVFSGEFDGKLTDAAHDESGDYIFILTGDTLSRINLHNRKRGSLKVEPGGFCLLVQEPDSFLLGLPNYALTYSGADFGEVYFDAAASGLSDETSSTEVTT